MVSDKRNLNNVVVAILAILMTLLVMSSGYAANKPEKPYPEDLGDGDRLYASYLNSMFGVLYNWAQNTQIELDKLLHNGAGAASATAELVKALNQVEAPLYKVDGRANPPSINTDDGYIYFDTDTRRLMGYQEGHWRDLSPLTIVGTDSLHSPLIIEGYMETTSSYVEQKLLVGNASETHNEISATSAKIDFGNDGAVRIPVNSNTSRLSTEFGQGSIAYNPATKKLLIYDGTNWISPVPEITVDSSISSTSTNPVQNKVVKSYVDNADSTTLSSAKTYADGKDTTTLNSAKTYADGKDTTTLNSAKTYADGKDTTTLNSAKTYADTVAATALSSAKTYADGKTTTNSSLSVKTVSTSGNATVGGNLTVSGTNLTADNIIADTGKFDEWLRLPTSTNSSAPAGSIAYNSTSSKLQYKDASGWKDIVADQSSSSAKRVMVEINCPLYKITLNSNGTYTIGSTVNYNQSLWLEVIKINDNLYVQKYHCIVPYDHSRPVPQGNYVFLPALGKTFEDYVDVSEQNEYSEYLENNNFSGFHYFTSFVEQLNYERNPSAETYVGGSEAYLNLIYFNDRMANGIIAGCVLLSFPTTQHTGYVNGYVSVYVRY